MHSAAPWRWRLLFKPYIITINHMIKCTTGSFLMPLRLSTMGDWFGFPCSNGSSLPVLQQRVGMYLLTNLRWCHLMRRETLIWGTVCLQHFEALEGKDFRSHKLDLQGKNSHFWMREEGVSPSIINIKSKAFNKKIEELKHWTSLGVVL